MLKAQRQEEMLDLLEKHSTMSVSLLAELLQCTMMTVRRDINDLEKQGLVQKVHGGVVLNKANEMQPSYLLRVGQNTEEKQRIGVEAAKLVQDGKCVFFDGGTTPYYVAKNLPATLSFTAITNSLTTAKELCYLPNVNVIMLGGELYKTAFSTNNSIAVEIASRFRADLAFISARAIVLPDGIFETALSLIEIKQKIVQCSNRVILLVDHTKFLDTALCLSVPLVDIDHIITDSGVQNDYLKQLDDIGISYTVV